MLFALIGDASGSLTAVVQRVIEGGPASMSAFSTDERSALAAHLDGAYRIVFIVIASITALGALLARTIPKPDWTLQR